jgi:pre-mRNA-processing factor 17
MSLVEAGYSSDEDVPTDDAFGLAKLPTTKKPRTEPDQPTTITAAAPHVLSEVRSPACRAVRPP